MSSATVDTLFSSSKRQQTRARCARCTTDTDWWRSSLQRSSRALQCLPLQTVSAGQLPLCRMTMLHSMFPKQRSSIHILACLSVRIFFTHAILISANMVSGLEVTTGTLASITLLQHGHLTQSPSLVRSCGILRSMCLQVARRVNRKANREREREREKSCTLVHKYDNILLSWNHSFPVLSSGTNIPNWCAIPKKVSFVQSRGCFLQ